MESGSTLDENNAAALKAAARGTSLADYLRAHIDRIGGRGLFRRARLRRDELR